MRARDKKNALYLSVNVFSTKVVIEDTIFTFPTGDGKVILRSHPSHAKVFPFAWARSDLRGYNFSTLFRLFSWFRYTLQRIVLSPRQILLFYVYAQDLKPWRPKQTWLINLFFCSLSLNEFWQHTRRACVLVTIWRVGSKWPPLLVCNNATPILNYL